MRPWLCKHLKRSQESVLTVGNWWPAQSTVDISYSVGSMLLHQKSNGKLMRKSWPYLSLGLYASKFGGQNRHILPKSVTLSPWPRIFFLVFCVLIPGHYQSAERRSSHVVVSRRNCTQQSPSWRARNFGTPAAEKNWKQMNMEKLKSLLRSTTLRFLRNQKKKKM